MNNKDIFLVGSASGIAASQSGCGEGPIVLQNSPFMKALAEEGLNLHWQAMLKPSLDPDKSILDKVYDHNLALANETASLVRQKKFFTVLGGDHSSAIGTWSGVVSETHSEGDIGLLWIDAHMDSHMPSTSPTGNIHGMPLACLLGYGEPKLTTILGPAAKLKPEHICMVGVRSFEPGEADLLERLGVKIFFIDEVKNRGLQAVIDDAYKIINNGTVAYGITLDIDSIDPAEAPATGVSEPGGLSAKELCSVLNQFVDEKKFIGMEIVEFDPLLDKNNLTEKLMANLIKAMTISSKL